MVAVAGCVTIFSGTHPFRHESQIETISAILRDVPPPLNLETIKTPPVLSEIQAGSMAKDSTDRYQRTKEVEDDLQRLRGQLSPHEKPRWIVWAFSGGGLLVLALVSAIVWIGHRGSQPTPTAVHAPVSVLIADFDKVTGDTVFSRLLERALEVGLEGASFITS